MKRLIGILVIGVLVVGASGIDVAGYTPTTRVAFVARAIDGDTIELGRGTHVRLIGVDTPEVFLGAECFGPEASLFTERHLEGERVRLEFDVQRRDRYGRTLAWVWDEGRLFNYLLVRKGFARVTIYRPNDRYEGRLRRAEAAARSENRGLWGAC
jgi:micrococcal nuclease